MAAFTPTSGERTSCVLAEGREGVAVDSRVLDVCERGGLGGAAAGGKGGS